VTATSAESYETREKRVQDAIALKQPDRVPFFPTTHLLAARYAGMTYEDAFYNADAWFDANREMIADFEPDIYFSPDFAIFSSGQAFEAVDFQQIKWPGDGVPANRPFQFVEEEYMKEDEYEAFLDDPSDFVIRTYMPRIYGTLEPLKKLPPIKAFLLGYAGVPMSAVFGVPEIAEAFKSLHDAAQEALKWNQASEVFHKEMGQKGFPCFAGSVAQAPFDIISDFLRGMRGSMVDMYRRPEQLQEATEKVFSCVLGTAIGRARMSGIPRVFMPLHRGADGFMSEEQFETFYWPTLKRLILGLIDAGLTPCPFFEGSYDSRLDYLAELPPGKVLGIFDRTDLFRAKEVLGDTMCIAGNMPVSLLQAGTPEKIEAYTKRLIEEVGEGGGFIMSCGGVMDEADIDLVRAWRDYTREYGDY